MTGPAGLTSSSLLIALVALARWNLCLSGTPDVLTQRTADVVDLLELTLFVSSDVAFVFSGVHQLSLAASCFAGHKNLLESFCQKITCFHSCEGAEAATSLPYASGLPDDLSGRDNSQSTDPSLCLGRSSSGPQDRYKKIGRQPGYSPESPRPP